MYEFLDSLDSYTFTMETARLFDGTETARQCTTQHHNITDSNDHRLTLTAQTPLFGFLTAAL